MFAVMMKKDKKKVLSLKIRVSAVQYYLHTIQSFEQFVKQVEHYAKTAQEFGAEFVL